MASEAQTQIARAVADLARLRESMGRCLVGQRQLVDRLLIGLATGGHLLIEGVPGLAKTLAARTLAAAVGIEFRRVQFTPDLLPADLLGTEVFRPQTGEFSLRKGPIVTQFLLADEINRAPAKVQSALLEAMQEHQISIGPHTIALPKPFIVVATQNPIEHEGTYPLPEAQVDRFLMKIRIDYPDREEERAIMRQFAKADAPWPKPDAAINADGIENLHAAVNSVYLDQKIENYILDLVRATRNPKSAGVNLAGYISLGASPRASLAFVLAAKGSALIEKREFVTPHDVASIAKDVLRHRITPSFEADVAGLDADQIVDTILDAIPVP